MNYKLSFDMGSTSIGWCLLEINKEKEPIKLIDGGVRIFSDGRNAKDQTPLSVIRRNARGMRRRLDRKKNRLTRLRCYLQERGFFSEDMDECKALVKLNPFEWRVKSLDEKIPLSHLGRILMHISKHRGFLSNRHLIDLDDTGGKIKEGIDNLTSAIGEYRTLGEYLWTRLKEGNSTRYRINLHEKYSEDGESKKQYVKKWDFYPQRSMFEDEVKKILESQSKFHQQLSKSVCEEIEDILFFQRPLKPVNPGYCTFKSSEKRARKAYPIVQKFRILQEVNNLQLLDNEDKRQLSDSDKKLIAEKLYCTNELKFSDIKKILKLPRTIKFNLEQQDKKSIKGDSTSVFFSQEKAFGLKWFILPLEKQNEIIDHFFNGTYERESANNAFNKWKRLKNEDDILEEWLKKNHALSSDQAHRCLEISLIPGYSNLSVEAVKGILRPLEEGLKYYEACKIAGYHQEEGLPDEALPYYGACLPSSVIGGTFAPEDQDCPERYFGKINNPSVHIALNQLRRLSNEIIKNYGLPGQIIIELARELKQKPADIIREQSKNKKENEYIGKELNESKSKINNNYINRLKWKLWKELKERCPFCGQSISFSELFSSSSKFEIEHILPFSVTLNDKRANKIISCRECNREKGNRTPYAAFGHFPKWMEILERIKNLPENKRWRFEEDALEQAKRNSEDIIARLLTDTQYMSRVAQNYLKCLYKKEERESKVMATSGQLTALLRRKWGLNKLLNSKENGENQSQTPVSQQTGDEYKEEGNNQSQTSAIERKERGDHRHHAIDAFVIGCTTRKMIQRISSEAERVETHQGLYERRHKLVGTMPEPYCGYLREVKEKLDQMIVSHRPNHRYVSKALRKGSTVAVLHKETAYGLITDPNSKKQKYVTRKPIESFEKFEEKDIKSIIVDSGWCKKLCEVLKDNNSKALSKESLVNFSKKEKVRRLRVFSNLTEKSMVKIYSKKDEDPEPYKYYESGNNYCAEIYCPTSADKKNRWECEIIHNYDAHQKGFIPSWCKKDPTAKLIMRLQINDMVAYEKDGRTHIAKVKKMTKKFINDEEKADIVKVKKMTRELVYLLDHNIARDEKDKNSWAASAKQLQEVAARKVCVDIMGKLKDSKIKIVSLVR